MSSIARWSYKYTATVKPFEAVDGMTGAILYGAEYDILCNVTAAVNEERLMGGASGANGNEAVATHVIYTEDGRPQKGDMIQFVESDGWQEILSRTFWDMTAFGDIPDYKLVT